LQNPAREASCTLRGHCAVAGAVTRADFSCRRTDAPARFFGLFACRPSRRDSSGYSFVARADTSGYLLFARAGEIRRAIRCYTSSNELHVTSADFHRDTSGYSLVVHSAEMLRAIRSSTLACLFINY